MRAIKNMLNENNVRLVFDISLWLKGVFALSEIIGGFVALFVSQQFLLNLALWVTKDEFAEDSNDAVATYILHSVQNLSIGTQNFVAIYLFVHGIIKLWLIVGLLKKKLSYYPVAMIVFGLFIIYQLYRYTFTHSIWLLLITLLDLIIIVLTAHEYKYLKNRAQD
jgi:uncharacterized membrane protein